MNQEPHPEDQTILSVVDALDGAPGGAPGPRGDDTAETLARLYTEVLGLIPFELSPEEPDPAVKDRLMAIVRGEEPKAAAPEPVPEPVPVPAPVAAAAPAPVAAAAPAPLPPPRPSGEVRVPAPVTPIPQPRRAVVRPSRWPLALAAALALLFLGLSAWLYTGLVQQGETIARLTREMETQKRRADQAAAEMEQARARMNRMREHFSVVTSPAVEVSPLRPAGETPVQPNARGMLFVAADHQHWYLSLEGLEPAGPGRAYKLWFEADQGTVPAGSFTAEPGAPIELSSKEMPAGTRGVMVTLETDPQAAAPTGPEVLRATGVFQII
ncbi:MAG TPA: anti-sigma factor [Thermoanaerobaculia bacterium]|nr:anti-sigma factor [Thermoanaerobaculia bacterium]